MEKFPRPPGRQFASESEVWPSLITSPWARQALRRLSEIVKPGVCVFTFTGTELQAPVDFTSDACDPIFLFTVLRYWYRNLQGCFCASRCPDRSAPLLDLIGRRLPPYRHPPAVPPVRLSPRYPASPGHRDSAWSGC